MFSLGQGRKLLALGGRNGTGDTAAAVEIQVKCDTAVFRL